MYAFWGSRITQVLNDAMQAQGDNVLVNLASNEYFKAVKKKELEGMVITPVFKDYKNDQYKIISFFAKKARGLMARYIIENEVSDVEGLQAFDSEGYVYSESQSTATELVFLRRQDA